MEIPPTKKVEGVSENETWKYIQAAGGALTQTFCFPFLRVVNTFGGRDRHSLMLTRRDERGVCVRVGHWKYNDHFGRLTAFIEEIAFGI
jgi:hypothetical protein